MEERKRSHTVSIGFDSFPRGTDENMLFAEALRISQVNEKRKERVLFFKRILFLVIYTHNISLETHFLIVFFKSVSFPLLFFNSKTRKLFL